MRNLAGAASLPQALWPRGEVDDLRSREPAANQLLRVEALVRGAEEQERAVSVVERARVEQPGQEIVLFGSLELSDERGCCARTTRPARPWLCT